MIPRPARLSTASLKRSTMLQSSKDINHLFLAQKFAMSFVMGVLVQVEDRPALSPIGQKTVKQIRAVLGRLTRRRLTQGQYIRPARRGETSAKPNSKRPTE